MKIPAGLTADAVERSRRQHGENQLTRARRRGFFRQLLSGFGDPIIRVLLAALAINLIFLFHRFDWYESAGIAAAVFLATLVSTLSEYGSESAFAKLQEDAARITCRVRRDGRVIALPVDQIVVGDIVLLQAGERIPADGVLLDGQLAVDQSALNGESKEARKRPAPGGDPGDLSAPARLFSPVVVCEGEGVMRVERVGDATFWGNVAREVQEQVRESPLRVRLAGLAGTLSRLGYAAAALVAAADLFHSFVMDNGFDPVRIGAAFTDGPTALGHLLHAVTLAVTVVVVAVPEGLPMMITVVLSSNMRRMLKDHVLVRKLVGIETSGSLNILFTDKTGTLTKGKLQVSRVVTGDGEEHTRPQGMRRLGLWPALQLSCALNNDSVLSRGRAIGGNATDRALLDFSGEPSRREKAVLSGKIPFDSERKYSAVRVEGERPLTLIKGAPEKLLAACSHYLDADGERHPLIPAVIRRRWEEMTGQAMRVLALAISDRPVTGEADFDGFTLVGLLGIRDELRPETPAAVRQVRDAGVQVVMITGDNRQTAAAIAKEAGVLSGENDLVLTGGELAAMSDEQIVRRLPRLRVVARALPGDKSRLVRLAQQAGLVAGMTGDGINDAPALKKADVGFAMGSGTEVAKEAGDIVILNDRFDSIGKAILYGRTIFKSIRKFVIFQLTMNLCAVGVSVIGPFIGVDTPVTVMQMLWINIIMDTLAGLAFAGEPPLPEYMREPPKRRDEPVLNRYMLHQILWMGLYTVALCVAFLKLPIFKGLFRFGVAPVYFFTAFFALFIFTGIFNSFNARTHRLQIWAHLSGNRAFLLIMAAVTGVQLLLIYQGGALFRTAGLTAGELQRVLLLALTVIPADAIRKLTLRLTGHTGHI
ncbi:MAG: calcium-translocating P-type ATPase, PMCA-type [Acutalibacteraceae bacterium]